MSPKRGLGGGVLGAHLGMEVPQLVRRAEDRAAPERTESPGGRALGAVLEPDATEQSAAPQEAPPPVVIASVPVPVASNIGPSSSEADIADDDSDVLGPAPRADRVRPRPLPKGRITTTGNVYRVGTQKNPYERRDGIRTQKVTFTAPHGLKREIERFCLDQDVSRSEWIASVLQREMDRVRRVAKKG